MLARYLTLVPVVDRQLCRRDFNQRGTRTRLGADTGVKGLIPVIGQTKFSTPATQFAIADLHNATLTIDSCESLGGLRATVIFKKVP